MGPFAARFRRSGRPVVAFTLGLGLLAACAQRLAGELPRVTADDVDGGTDARMPVVAPLPRDRGAEGEPTTVAERADAATEGAVKVACASAEMRCSVPITLPARNERAVELRGSWAPATWQRGVAMVREGGLWRARLSRPVGTRVEYKFCVNPRADGSCERWISDPAVPALPPHGNHVIDAVTCATPACPPAEEETVRFIAVGDTGRGDEGQSLVAAAMAAQCEARGCHFVVMLGDNIYPSGASSPTDAQFQTKFESMYLALDVPFYMALGNHDYGGDGAGNEPWKADHEIAYTSRSPRWRMPSAFFHVRRGPVELFAMDTNAQLYGNAGPQKSEMTAWLAASQAPWKIMAGHHPYLSNGTHGNAGSYDGRPDVSIFNGEHVKAFADSVWCGRADLYLAGHDHSRQWLGTTCDGTALAVSGAGSWSSPLPGRNPMKFQSSELGFLYVTASAHTLVTEFVHASGTVEHVETLTK